METGRILELDDFSAVRALEVLASMFGDVAPDGASPGLAGLFRAAAEADASAPLQAQDPANVARSLLLAFAEDEAFEEIVAAAVERSADTQLAAKPILAVGVAASLIIVAATTGMKVDVGPVHIEKTTASPELVTKISEILRPYAPGAKPTALPDGRPHR